MADISVVMWKESKSLVTYRGSRWRFALTVFMALGFSGFYLPLRVGRSWVDSPMVLACLIGPLLLISMTIPESFAGEREHHTLPTLLASRLPDRAILFGKLAVSIGFGWGMTLLALLVSLVTVNVFNRDGHLLMYSPTAGLAAAGLSLLFSVAMAGAGVLISLRSARAHDAQQWLAIATMVPGMIAGTATIGLFLTVDFWAAALIIGAILAVIGAALITLAMARFRRARLILG